MPDIDTLSPGDALPAGTPVLCCGTVMETAASTFSCAVCGTVIETRHGLVFNIRD